MKGEKTERGKEGRGSRRRDEQNRRRRKKEKTRWRGENKYRRQK